MNTEILTLTMLASIHFPVILGLSRLELVLYGTVDTKLIPNTVSFVVM